MNACEIFQILNGTLCFFLFPRGKPNIPTSAPKQEISRKNLTQGLPAKPLSNDEI